MLAFNKQFTIFLLVLYHMYKLVLALHGISYFKTHPWCNYTTIQICDNSFIKFIMIHKKTSTVLVKCFSKQYLVTSASVPLPTRTQWVPIFLSLKARKEGTERETGCFQSKETNYVSTKMKTKTKYHNLVLVFIRMGAIVIHYIVKSSGL